MPNVWDEDWITGDRLGAGAQGTTYLVTSRKDENVKGVLKSLRNFKSEVPRLRMQREGANLEILSNLGAKVPRLLDSSLPDIEAKEEMYLVMEHIEGQTLKSFVEKSSKGDINLAVGITLQICDVIRIAHLEGILHRDIKPDNIIIKDDLSIFMVDYGLSFNKEDDDLTETNESFRNKFLSLPETIAPGGDRRDKRSDVTAACAIFYFIITGHEPGLLSDETGKMPHLRANYSVRQVISNDSRVTAVELLLSRGFASNIQSRYQTIEELAARLQMLGANPEGKYGNPKNTAEELTKQLHAHDRKTQLNSLRKSAADTASKIANMLTGYGDLGSFRARIISNQGVKLPTVELLSDAIEFVVDAYLHEFSAHRAYIVAARDMQIIVLATNYEFRVERTQTSVHKFVHTDGWREIAWYAGDNKQALIEVRSDLDLWLDESMNVIASKILASEQA